MTNDQIQALQESADRGCKLFDDANESGLNSQMWDAGSAMREVLAAIPYLCDEILSLRAELTAIANEVDVPLPDGVEPPIVKAIRALHEQVASVHLQASQARAENAALRDRVKDLEAQPEPPADLVEQVAEAVEGDIAEAIGTAYDCIRVWEAWWVGTMRADDFQPITDNPERLREISTAAARAVLALLQPRLEAADALLRAAEGLRQHGVFEPGVVAGLWSAIAAAKAAGIGGRE